MSELVQLTKEEASEQAVSDINKLLPQLSEKTPPITLERLKNITGEWSVELWVARDDNRIVGIATLVILVVPEGIKGRIEDVVVDQSERGKGLGSSLMKKLFERAKIRGANALELSSRAKRTEANKLYEKMGMEKAETNVYRLKL